MVRNPRLSFATIALLLSGAPAPAQDKPKESAREAFVRAAPPGEHHKHLDALKGRWSQLIRARLGPDRPWSEPKGSAEYRWILGGRFLEERQKGEFLGRPFKSIGTGMDCFEGSCDSAGKVFTYTGEHADAPGAKQKLKFVMRVGNPDRVMLEWYSGESQSIEVISTRER